MNNEHFPSTPTFPKSSNCIFSLYTFYALGFSMQLLPCASTLLPSLSHTRLENVFFARFFSSLLRKFRHISPLRWSSASQSVRSHAPRHQQRQRSRIRQRPAAAAAVMVVNITGSSQRKHPQRRWRRRWRRRQRRRWRRRRRQRRRWWQQHSHPERRAAPSSYPCSCP